MSIDSQQAMNTVRAYLDNIESVEEGIVRGVKRYGKEPYALFYVDFSGKITERANDLAQFQDRILGKNYFNSENDLRWNSYLLLLADKSQLNTSDVVNARTALEGDRSYARKFVIAQEELESRLDSRSLNSDAPAPDEVSDAVGRWRQILDEVGLGETFAETGIAAIIRSLVEKPTSAVQFVRRQTAPKSAISLAGRSLAHLELVKFRRFPELREFDCGSVNLIRGVNGVGKTTFLEAVEFLFCGSTRRAGVPPDARVVGRMTGVTAPIETSTQTQPQVFRDRNLAWYGKRDVNRNNMVDSFAVYNFLNTDAAVDLSAGGDPVRLETDLATLLLGPEAARVWARIEQLMRDLPAERRSLERQCESLQSRIKAERERLAAAENSAKTSDEIFAKLRSDLAQLRWKQQPSAKQEAIPLMARTLADVESGLRRVMDLPELPLERNMAAFVRALNQNVDWLKAINNLLTEGSSLAKQRSSSNETVNKLSALRDEINRLREYCDSGYSATVNRERELKNEVADLVKKIGGIELAAGTADHPWPETPMKVLLDELRGQVRRAAEQEASTKAAFESFKIQKGQVESLHRDLRSTARQLLQLIPNQESCPLCQSTFPPGELENHIFGSITTGEGNIELEFTQAMVAAREAHLRSAKLLESIENLTQYRVRWDLSEQLTAATVIQHVQSSNTGLASRELELRETTSRRVVLEKNGFNAAEWESLQRNLAIKIEGSLDPERLKGHSQTCEEQLASEQVNVAKCEQRIAELRDAAATLRANAAPDVQGPLKNVQEAITRRINSLESARDAYEMLQKVVEVVETTPLRTVFTALTAASASSERLRLALQVESSAESSLNDAKVTLAHTERDHTDTAAALSRVRAGEKALEEIRSQHSREMVSKDLLRACRVEVATIFSRIHSPHEFRVSDSDVAPLERIDTHEPIELNKISSGQRAAFALSLFLALNVRAKAAPGILLIDDPVAHVDDLNTLSFLDYLRDVAVSGGRQIFFATADEKLAALFAHKFSFLGEQFRNQLFTRA
jgi:DNA repair protein SbcC/Rad50